MSVFIFSSTLYKEVVPFMSVSGFSRTLCKEVIPIMYMLDSVVVYKEVIPVSVSMVCMSRFRCSLYKEMSVWRDVVLC